MAGYKELVAFLTVCSVFVFVNAQNLNVTFRYVTSNDRNGRLVTKEDIKWNLTIQELKKSIFIVNGISNNSWYDILTNEYFQKDYYNIFIVEWNLSYDVDIAKTNALVGTEIADFVAGLLPPYGRLYAVLHFVGIRQGALASGFASKQILKLNERKVDRITALEPDYDLIDSDPKYWSWKANFVDTVYSDVDGFRNRIKHSLASEIDFYVDSPKNCSTSADSCSLVAVQYFAQSIRTDKYKGVECISLDDFRAGKCDEHNAVVFGENVNFKRSSYFLDADEEFQLINPLLSKMLHKKYISC